MSTLDDVLLNGRGIERPFQCPAHGGDSPNSASVNVVKGVWYCYVCGASGTTDGKNKAPSMEALQLMLEPERLPRVYNEASLELYDVPVRWQTEHYWAKRFPQWLITQERLGQDPFSYDCTFPVRTPGGLLAGVGRRRSDEDVKKAEEDGSNPARYIYPRAWSASRTLHGWPSPIRRQVIVLVEGMADRLSLLECGIPAYAYYGSGLHHPQVELVLRMSPELVVLGGDMDDAGNKGSLRSRDALWKHVPTTRAVWPEKDPGECTPDQRIEAVLGAVTGAEYRVRQRTGDLLGSWITRVTDAINAFDATTEHK